jgi:hypothetical protein
MAGRLALFGVADDEVVVGVAADLAFRAVEASEVEVGDELGLDRPGAGLAGGHECLVGDLAEVERDGAPLLPPKTRVPATRPVTKTALRLPTRGEPAHGYERKRSALDWMAVAVEEHGREIVEVYLQAMRKGDWRAAEALMSRIYGKPEQTVRQVEVNPAIAVLKSMSLDEKLELLRRLQDGEFVSTPSALPRAACPRWTGRLTSSSRTAASSRGRSSMRPATATGAPPKP